MRTPPTHNGRGVPVVPSVDDDSQPPGPSTDRLPRGPNQTPVITRPDAQGDPLIGVDVGDGYAISSKIAEGGMGALYVAQHRDAPNKQKAIKVLLPSLMARLSPHTREDIWNRFQVEAKIALRLDHPNVINVDGWGTLPSGSVYIKMELLKGKNLRQWARDRHDGKVPADEVLQVLAQVCSALEQAHRMGVVHRDLKPENVFMVEDDTGAIRTKLLDFGIARVLDPHGLQGGKKTTVPRAMGTPGYWSPEQQTSPGDVDHRADLYALGVITYELLTGGLPGFGSLAPHQLPASFPREWYEPIAMTLSGDPAQRPQSVRHFLAMLIDRTVDGVAIAAAACPTLYKTAVSAADATMKAPSLGSVPGLRTVEPPPPAPPLPPSTLAQAAGAYGTQAPAPRRGRLLLAALGGAVAAGAVAFAIVAASGRSGEPEMSPSPASPAPVAVPAVGSSSPEPIAGSEAAPVQDVAAPGPVAPTMGASSAEISPSPQARAPSSPAVDAIEPAAKPSRTTRATTRPAKPSTRPRRTSVERLDE